ncbi:NAD(P)H-binding protein [Ferroplasma sp.]|uniref:NAD(P)H-binding protein n=1 Tax=Ferroplasma sp. TaxID=2591003 RepID=UPI00260C5B8E|nr:NAD(P)H-binding protein [Ferroplasma sp.]MCL4452905.1 NAD(P)H-binding protein [Candidatus Thermoplasmatota archaeon]
MKLIVLGGSGFVGSNILKQMDAEEKAYFSRNNSEELDSLGIKYIKGDIREYEDVKNAIENYDVVVHAVDVLVENEETHEDLSLKGMKNIVQAMQELRGNRKLIYFSAINADKGKTDYFRYKRLAEDNASLIKTSLIIRPSTMFGPGDKFTKMLINAAKGRVPYLPRSGNMAPVHINDVITVIKNSMERSGVIDVCTRERVSFADMFNVIRAKLGMQPVKEVTSTIFKPFIGSLEKRGVLTKEQFYMLQLDYYKENTSLYRYVAEPITYKDYIASADIEKLK